MWLCHSIWVRNAVEASSVAIVRHNCRVSVRSVNEEMALRQLRRSEEKAEVW